MASTPPANQESPDDRAKWLRLLRRNVGFDEPEDWVDYARRHGFQDVRAEQLHACPDCGGAASSVIGQYVYYSTLLRLRGCSVCGLVYADARLDEAVIRAHFESAYKDEAYFRERRAAIFAQLARLADAHAPKGASVLDVGGAKGHLLCGIRSRRPDLRLTLNDLSQAACDAAANNYGFRTICGGIAALESCAEQFDVVVMSDVLYYEPDLPAVWRLLPRLVSPGGSVLIRVPNRLLWIRAGMALERWRHGAARGRATQISFFNPEHLYSFSRLYLLRRLRSIGFVDVVAHPTPLLARGRGALAARAAYGLACAIHLLSGGRVVTPAMVVAGRRPQPG